MSSSAAESWLSLRSYAAAQEVHSHPHHQIVLPLEGCLEILPLEGCLEMETDIAGAAVDEATAAVITAGREHAFRARGENRFLVLDVPRRGCAAAGARPAPVRARVKSLSGRVKTGGAGPG